MNDNNVQITQEDLFEYRDYYLFRFDLLIHLTHEINI